MYQQYSLNCAFGKCIIKWKLYTYCQKYRRELNSLQGFSHLDASLKAGPSNQNSTDSCYIYCVVLTTSRTTYTHIDSLCRISTKQARGVKAFATEARPAAAATRPRWVARLACCSIGFSTGYLDRSAIRALRRTRRHCTVATLATFFVKISLKRLIK